MKPELSHRLLQRPELRQIPAPMIIQSISILQLPALRLGDLIKQNLEENPALEIERAAQFEETGLVDTATFDDAYAQERPADFEPGDGQLAPPGPRETGGDGSQAEFERLDAYQRRDAESYTDVRPQLRGSVDRDPKHEAMQNSAGPGQSLQDYLSDQLGHIDLEPYQRIIGEAIVYNLDSNGYLRYHLEEIVENLPRDLPIPGFEIDPPTPDAIARQRAANAELRSAAEERAAAVARGTEDETQEIPALRAQPSLAERSHGVIGALQAQARATDTTPIAEVAARHAGERAPVTAPAGRVVTTRLAPRPEPTPDAESTAKDRAVARFFTPLVSGRDDAGEAGDNGAGAGPPPSAEPADDDASTAADFGLDDDDLAGVIDDDVDDVDDAVDDDVDDDAEGDDDAGENGKDGSGERKRRKRRRRVTEALPTSRPIPLVAPAPPTRLAVPRDEYFEVMVAEAEEVLDIVQRNLDPPGVAAYALTECLLLQVDDDDPYAELLRAIITKHLDDVTKNRIPKIAKDTDATVDEVIEGIARLRLLNPRPGAEFANDQTYYVVPDVVVREIDGEYYAEVIDRYFPKIRVNPDVAGYAKSKDLLREDREKIKAYIGGARTLQECIEQREETLRRVAQRIIDIQRDYFDKGIEGLKPLKMQDVAIDLSLHVSTVSRAVSGKYIDTPRGIMPMKYFFRGGATKTDGTGDEENVEIVKSRLQDIVDEESKQKPLSDVAIVKQLEKKHGLKVARRTVTKYRKIMGIPSSRERRAY